MKNLNEHGFLIHYEEAGDWESDQASRPLPEWSEIREMKILPLRAKVKGEVRYNMREGGFFPYLLRPDIQSKPLIEALQKCEIFQEVVGNEDKLSDSCWVYAHRQAGIPSEVIDKMTIRVESTQDSHLKIDEVLNLSREQGINVIIHYYDDDSRQSRIVAACKKGVIEEPIASLEINCYKSHYFLEHRTDIHHDYLRAMFEGNQVADKYHACRYDRGKWYKSKSKPCMMSGALVKYLMDNGAFVPMQYHHYAALPSVKTPDESVFHDLHYNPDYCLTTIEEMEAKKAARTKQRDAIMRNKQRFHPSDDKPVFFGDTEADTIGSKFHRAYSCYVTSFLLRHFYKKVTQ